jgi:predicted alpha/beta superfamily hydrolase
MNQQLRRVSLVFATVFLIVAALNAQPGAAPHSETYPKVPILGSEVRSIHSSNTGRDYDLYVHLPSGYDKETAKRYPVLYVLDGQWDFKLMDSVLGGLVYDRFVPPMIIVGITYSGQNPDYDQLRAMDYTPVAASSPKGSGDGPKFYAFLKRELIPYVEKTYRGDSERRVLLGSSFGGLFTLYSAFTEPGLFQGYISLSPAVPFGSRFAFKQEADFARTHKELPVKLFIAVGEVEPLAGPVQDFMKTLSSRGYKGLQLETRVLSGEGHASNKPEGYNRGLRFVFEKQ